MSSKPLNLKRNNRKKIPKKKVETSNNHPKESLATNSTHENEEGTKTEALNDFKVKSDGINNKNAGITNSKVDGISEDVSDGKNFKALNDDSLTIEPNNAVNVELQTELEVAVTVEQKEVLMTENVSQGQEKEERNLELEVDTMKQDEMVEQVEKVEPLENDKNNKIDDELFQNIDLQNNEEMEVDNQSESSQKFGVDQTSNFGVDENLLDNKDEQPKKQQKQDLVAESIQNLDLFSFPPVAASTPQKKELVRPDADNNDQGSFSYNADDNGQLNNLNDLLSEFPENQNAEQEVVLDGGNKVDENLKDNNEMTMVNESVQGVELKEEVGGSTSNQVGHIYCRLGTRWVTSITKAVLFV